MESYKIFNMKAKEFIKDIIKSYPDIKELKLMYVTFKFIKKMSKKAPCKFFDMLISPHKEQILLKDDSFIYKDDFKIIFISNIKNILKTISPENKEHIWAHLHLLIKLSEQCDIKNVSIDDFESIPDSTNEDILSDDED